MIWLLFFLPGETSGRAGIQRSPGLYYGTYSGRFRVHCPAAHVHTFGLIAVRVPFVYLYTLLLLYPSTSPRTCLYIYVRSVTASQVSFLSFQSPKIPPNPPNQIQKQTDTFGEEMKSQNFPLKSKPYLASEMKRRRIWKEKDTFGGGLGEHFVF